MWLVWLNLRHFRRFQDARVNLDAPVIALVGPNEAGKSTLLEAIVAMGRSGEKLTWGKSPDKNQGLSVLQINAVPTLGSCPSSRSDLALNRIFRGCSFFFGKGPGAGGMTRRRCLDCNLWAVENGARCVGHARECAHAQRGLLITVSSLTTSRPSSSSDVQHESVSVQ